MSEIATVKKEALDSATKKNAVVPVNSASTKSVPDEPYVAVKDGVDSRTTDSFVPRATLAARCPLLTEDELDEEAGKVKKKEAIDANGVLNDDEAEDDVMMVFKLTQGNEEPPWWVILPNNKKRQYWDLLIVVCVLYNAAVVPLDVAFELADLEFVNLMTDFLFIIDMIVHFLSAYIDEKENKVILDPRLIRLHYIKSVFFYIDFASTFPWDYLFKPISNDPNLKMATKFVGCIKMLRLLRLAKFFRWLHDHFGVYVNQVRVFELFFSFLLYSHWVGCMFYFIDVSIYDSTQWERCDDLTNIDGLEPGSRCYYTVGYGPDGSEPSYEFVEARRDQDKYGDGTQSIKMDYYKVYADLFYIGVQVVVGEGHDTTGAGTTLFLALCSTIGCGLSAVIFGSFADIVSNANSVVGMLQHKFDIMGHAMKKLEMPVAMQERMHEFFEFKAKRLDGYDDLLCFDELSPALKSEVRNFSNLDMLKNLDLFDGLREEIVCMLASKSERCFFVPRDVLFKENQPNDAMHVVLFGFVAITSTKHPDRFTLKPGEYCGEMALCRACAKPTHVIPLLNAATSTKSLGMATALTFVETMKISANDFESVLQIKGAWAVRQKFFLGFKQRAMMLNMLCKSLEWIHVDNCFYSWRELVCGGKYSDELIDVANVSDMMKMLLQRIDRLEEKFDSKLDAVQSQIREKGSLLDSL